MITSTTSAAPVSATPTLGSERASVVPVPPHEDAKHLAKSDLTGGKQGSITSEVLENGVRLIVAERPGAKKVKVQVGVGAGSMQDPSGKLGMAHLLEHLAFEGSEKYSSAKQQDMRNKMGGVWNAYTDQDSIVYYGVAPTKDAAKAADLLGDMVRNPNLKPAPLAQERSAVKNEIMFRANMGVDNWEHWNSLVFGNKSPMNNIIGTPKSIDAIAAKDMQAYHGAYFTGRNTVALVEGDPKNLPLDAIKKQLLQLPAGARVDHTTEVVPAQGGTALKIVPDRDARSVNLTMTLPVPKSVFDKVPAHQRSLVLTSLGNQLHDRMRRSHDLTYGVMVDVYTPERSEDTLVILETSVAPENAKAVARDFAAITKDAIDGFGPQTLKDEKASLKSYKSMVEPPVVADNQMISARAEGAFQTALLQPGVTIMPPLKEQSPAALKRAEQKAMRQINAVTYKQFQNASKQLIDMSRMKLLVTGNADAADIRAGLREGGVDTRKMQIVK